MEFVGQPRLSGTCNVLEVPGPPGSLDVDSDEGEVVIGIRPKSSPLPRRRSSSTDEDSEAQPPLSRSRRVSFADAKGLSLVQVKQFDTWDVPKLPGYGSAEGGGKEAEEYFLSPRTFSLPLSAEELFVKVRDQRLELETIELLPKTTILKGVIRVLNISFDKAVYVRTTLDTWSSYFDLLAEYIPGSTDGLMDRFSFKLALVPPFGEQGAKVEFCLRYETPVGTFWANNDNRNYVLFCHRREKDTPQRDNGNVKRSCLKTVSQNISTVDSSPEEKSSAFSVVTKYADEAPTMKAKQICDGEDEQKIKAENRRISSRRSVRKAARTARVRDHFAQRGNGGSDTEKDEIPPEEAARGQKQVGKHSDVPSPSGGGSGSELQVVSESLGTRGESLHDVLRATSPANDRTSDSEPEKPESNHLSDSATLTGGGRATDTSDDPHGEPAAAAAACRAGGEAQSTGFTFGTVVAPLYRHMFGRAGGENENIGEWGDPAQATANIGESTESCPHAEGKESCCCCCCAPLTDLKNNTDTSQGNVMNTQDSPDATSNNPPNEEELTRGVCVTDVQDCTGNPQHPGEVVHSDQGCTDTPEVPEALSGDAGVNVLHPDLLSTNIPNQPGEAQEDCLSWDFQNHNTEADAAQAQTPEKTSSQTESNGDTREAEDVPASPENVLLPLQPDADETVQQTNEGEENERSPEEGNPEEPLQIHHRSATTGTESVFMSNGEEDAERGNDSSTPSQETPTESRNGEEENKSTDNRCEEEKEHSGETEVNDEEDESMTKAIVSNNPTCDDDTYVESKEEEPSQDEPAALLQQGFTLADAPEEKNWEMMVEEDEKNILADQEATCLKADTETDQRGRSEDTGIETEPEDRNSAERQKDPAEELGGAGENGAEAGDAEGLEDKESDGGEVWKGGEKTEAEEEEDRDGDVEVEKGEEQEETELEGEQHFTEMQEVGKIVREHEEIEGEEDLQTYLNNGDDDGAVWDDQVKPREENIEEENPQYKVETAADGGGDSESVTAEDGEDEVSCLEETLDEDEGSSALMNRGSQAERATDKHGEEGSAHIPAETHFYKEEDFQAAEDVAHDRAEAERWSPVTEGDSCVLTDESDSDDEVELYMHCLRAVHTGAQASRDTGFSVGKRPSISRGKLLSMPSITESLDEEPHLGCHQDNQEDTEAAGVQPAAPTLQSGRDNVSTNLSWWKQTFSCSNISRTLLCITLFVVFLVLAYHYDFLTCFGLYLISVVWLCCQGERQPVENKNRKG